MKLSFAAALLLFFITLNCTDIHAQAAAAKWTSDGKRLITVTKDLKTLQIWELVETSN